MQLAHEDALALATAWGHKLHGRVSLQPPSHSGWLHPRDEQWIVIELQNLARHSVRLDASATAKNFLADVREALDVWHAIACCPGYTGAENPVFWRTVISRAYRRSHQRQRGCSDEHAFFAQLRLGADFPRFRLSFEDRLSIELTLEVANEEASHVQRVWREFFCLSSQDHEPSMEYTTAMETLQPCISSARYAHSIPVAVDLPSWDPRFMYPCVKNLLTETRSQINDRTSRFKVEELSFDDMRLQTHEDAEAPLGLWMQLPEVTISHYWWRQRTTGDASMLIHAATSLSASSVAKLRTLVISRQALVSEQFADVCIALTHSQSLRQVRFPQLKNSDDWAWMALALFHPVNGKTSWRELSIDMASLTREDIAVIRAVRANGPGALVPSISSSEDGPQLMNCRVRLPAGSIPISGGMNDTGSMLLKQGTLEYAGVYAPEVPSGVCAFVPGFGPKWIPQAGVAEVLPYPETPPQSNLSVLRSSSFDAEPAVLRDFLCEIGASLQVVDIAENARLSQSDVTMILQSCPALESLNVACSSHIFIDQVGFVWPKLTTLSVSMQSKAEVGELMRAFCDPVRSPVPALRHLRIDLTDATAQDEAENEDVYRAVASLLRENHRTEHIRLVGVKPPRPDETDVDTLTYEAYRERVLDTLQLTDDDLVRSKRLTLAFLCTLDDKRTARSQLTPDLIQAILAFVGRKPASVWIDLN